MGLDIYNLKDSCELEKVQSIEMVPMTDYLASNPESILKESGESHLYQFAARSMAIDGYPDELLALYGSNSTDKNHTKDFLELQEQFGGALTDIDLYSLDTKVEVKCRGNSCFLSK